MKLPKTCMAIKLEPAVCEATVSPNGLTRSNPTSVDHEPGFVTDHAGTISCTEVCRFGVARAGCEGVPKVKIGVQPVLDFCSTVN